MADIFSNKPIREANRLYVTSYTLRVILFAMKSIMRLIFIILVVGLVTYGIYYFIKRSTTDEGTVLQPTITSLTLEKPNFVIKGRGLAKVEVWAIPTGTNITEAQHVKIGIAELKTPNAKEQAWLIPIPREPLLLTEIFAKGFDQEGHLVGKVSLPITGASDIYRDLWLEAPQQSLFLKIGEVGTVGDLSVKVLRVVSDSRCPVDVTCIQAGNVVVELELTRGGKTSKLTVASDEDGKPFDDHFIQILDVLPVTRSTTPIAQGDYIITISVLKDVKL